MSAELSGPAPDPTKEAHFAARATELARDLIDVKADLEKTSKRREELNAAYEELDAAYRAYTGAVYGEQRSLTVTFYDSTGAPQVAYWRADEMLTVDLGALQSELIKRYGVVRARDVIDSITTPPRVSAPKFDAAVERGDIPLEVAAKVATLKPKAGYIAFGAAT